MDEMHAIQPLEENPKRDMMESRRHSLFSWDKADALIEKLLNGKTLTEICDMDGMPSRAQLAVWRHKYPEFKEMLREVQTSRADFLVEEAHAQAHKVAEEADKDAAVALRPKLDFVKWMAEKLNPETYGQKSKVTQTKEHIARIIIDTGIRRKGDAGYRVDETEKLKDVGPESDD